jgi:DNA-binding transcriptional ArsR family regulator
MERHERPQGSAFEALGDETRRAIVALLQGRELAVGQLARELPVTRPAVSQHLKVLKEAGLVTERAEGTRRFYRLERGGFESLRRYVQELWEDRLERFAAAAEAERRKGEDMQRHSAPEKSGDRGGPALEALRLDPVVKTIVVPLPQERAFSLFFEGMTAWWPLATHSVYGGQAAGVWVEARAGGRIVERATDGREAVWGEVLVWDPPRRALLTWHPGYEDDAATELELRFTEETDPAVGAVGEGGEGHGGGLTRVDLEHRAWERLGERARTARAGYETGWNFVFGVRFGAAAIRS